MEENVKKKALVLISLVILSFICGCQSNSVQRIDPSVSKDLSGYWNDTDVRFIADTLVQECVDAPAIRNYIVQNKKFPTLILGSFKNLSDEHLDTSIVAKKFEAALVNSGKVDFVADSKEREEIRKERVDQLEHASEETAKSLGYEIGADFMLIGTVKTIVDSADGKSVRNYIVNAELIDVETNRKLWVGENSDIKKFISRSKVRF
ncbi:MAG: penicillin-binding protein activator LpoB [Treponema sp.]|mgnify:CR=1 FL=1|jgi:uncharacterized protein (TIGR02722 family)|nr:penicillin-binding protein activator LpoB [Treponema sp.]